jgi:predicted amidohydrolase
MTQLPPDAYRVAAIQFEPLLGAKAENVARLLALAEQAAEGGARLIVLPEMATTGYCWHSRDEVRPHAEPIPGPTTDAFAALARRHNCYLVVGMPEVAPRSGIFYNSAALVGPGGLAGVYRKTHSYVSELKWAKDGDLGLPVWETPLGRIGILICMDAGYFEPARLLALAGADVLCFPTNWLGEKSPSPAWSARAYENGCYLVGANRYGLERGVQFSGGSCVLNPDGTVQATRDTGDGVVYGMVSPAAARAKSFGADGPPEKLAARRPALYDTMTLNSYLWQPMELHGLYGHRPLPPGRRSPVGVAQLAPLPGGPAANLPQIERALASMGSVDLAVFPEYALTGRPGDARGGEALGVDEAEDCYERLVALARRFALHLAAGYAERGDGRVYSSLVLAGPGGVVVRYRKAHVVGEERAWCSAGDDKPPVVDLPLGRVGLLLGTDLCFPELPRHLALEGCDLVVAAGGAGLPPPLAVAAAAGPSYIHLARQRAVENNSYVAFASPPAPHGIGCSGVFGPEREGEALLGAHEQGVATRAVDTTHVDAPYPGLAAVRAKALVGMRQPHLYEPLQRCAIL